MNSGKVFEQQFIKSLPDSFYKLRLHDSASSFGQDSKSVRFSMKSPFDFVLYHFPIMYCLELKTTKSTSFSFERCKEEKKEIHYHQIEALKSAQSNRGIVSGFVLDFRNGDTFFMSINDFCKFMDESSKKSINQNDCIHYGAILINKQKLKVHYKYDLEKLFSKIEGDKNGTFYSL